MRIVVAGPKGAGKTTVGDILAELTGLKPICVDTLIEDKHHAQTGKVLSCRDIYLQRGEEVFRQLERDVVADVAAEDWCVVATGGSTMLDPESRRRLRRDAVIVYLTADPEVLWERATKAGLPPWLEGPDGRQKFDFEIEWKDELIRPFADVVLDAASAGPAELAEQATELIARELALRCQAANTYGDVIRVTTFGESHGPAIGCVLDGIQPGVELSAADIQRQLDRRRPGQSKLVTQRKESDRVHILSGVFEGKTTGAPIALLINNEDQKPGHYDAIEDLFRPGHADFTFYRKYAIRDHRGGGRSSGRETAARVAGGAVAQKILAERGVRIVAHTVEVAGIVARTCDSDEIENNPVRCADPAAAKAMEEAILAARADRDSVGGIVQLEVHGVPAGLGDPVFGKLSARLCSAIMTIGAIKGVEIGGGFQLARLRGSEANDSMADGGFLSNHAGGLLGGISNGEPIVLRVAVKPTSSIAKPQQTLDTAGENRTIATKGRHDPCIVPRAVPVIEAMAALTLLDAWEIQDRLRPGWNDSA